MNTPDAYGPPGGPIGRHGAYPAGAAAHDPGPDVGSHTVGELLGNVTRDLSTLVRQEFALAQAELKQEASRAGKAAGAMGAAGFAGWFAVLFLSVALYAGLSNLMNPGWAALIVAVLWAVIAAALFVSGRSTLRRLNPKPERTIDTLSQVPDALKGRQGGTS